MSILDKVKNQIFSEIVDVADKEMVGFEVVASDPYLKPHFPFFYDLKRRVLEIKERIAGDSLSLEDFASAHDFFGLHFVEKTRKEEAYWVFREWAPNACSIYLLGSFNGWEKREEFRFQSIENGNWELKLPAEALTHFDLYRLQVEWHGGSGERLPACVRRVVQDDRTKLFSAQVWNPENQYKWKIKDFRRKDESLLIYECHVGMAQEEEKIGSYLEFKEKILPRIVKAGYNTIQIMAVQEHPYYGSFGYQVSNFFAASSRFGTPEELKELIDAAHKEGIAVLLDIVHSHSVKNENEGLSCFDGTLHQYFHAGEKGDHPVWDSRLFDYGKTEVLHFLLSNIKYWIQEFHFDGFRFDGITSMLYHDHGLGDPFCSYDSYFSGNLDRDSVTYLCLANELAHTLKSDVITIAEDVSGFPGLAAPLKHGGIGFDYRLAMGIPDFWTKTIEDQKDEDWNVEWMFWELINRRADEKTIAYAESHDQALVGDQTIIFRLLETLIYDSMRIEQQNHLIERSMALHYMIRLMTILTSGHGYLNFMGNEFGHPEWIDFPRDGNDWSFHHARRLWHLADNPELQYHRLAEFDREMVNFVREVNLYSDEIVYKHFSHVHDQVLVFSRAGYLFVFSFNPFQSFGGYPVDAWEGEYELLFSTDEPRFGGTGQVQTGEKYVTFPVKEGDHVTHRMRLFVPTRSALVLKKIK